jgi:hypothetical protein
MSTVTVDAGPTLADLHAAEARTATLHACGDRAGAHAAAQAEMDLADAFFAVHPDADLQLDADIAGRPDAEYELEAGS